MSSNVKTIVHTVKTNNLGDVVSLFFYDNLQHAVNKAMQEYERINGYKPENADTVGLIAVEKDGKYYFAAEITEYGSHYYTNYCEFEFVSDLNESDVVMTLSELGIENASDAVELK